MKKHDGSASTIISGSFYLKFILVYELHSLENVLALARSRMLCQNYINYIYVIKSINIVSKMIQTPANILFTEFCRFLAYHRINICTASLRTLPLPPFDLVLTYFTYLAITTSYRSWPQLIWGAIHHELLQRS